MWGKKRKEEDEDSRSTKEIYAQENFTPNLVKMRGLACPETLALEQLRPFIRSDQIPHHYVHALVCDYWVHSIHIKAGLWHCNFTRDQQNGNVNNCIFSKLGININFRHYYILDDIKKNFGLITSTTEEKCDYIFWMSFFPSENTTLNSKKKKYIVYENRHSKVIPCLLG